MLHPRFIAVSLFIFAVSGCVDWSGYASDNANARVIDGLDSDDVDFSNVSTKLGAHWQGFAGDIVGYEHQVSASPDCAGDAVVGAHSVGLSTRTSLDDVALAEGKVFNCVRSLGKNGPLSDWVSSDGIVIDLTPPHLTGIRPSEAIPLKRTEEIVMTFDGPIDPQTANSTNVRVRAFEADIPGEVTLEAGGSSVRFKPSRPWPRLARIDLRVGEGLRDLAGNALAPQVTKTLWSADGAWSTAVELMASPSKFINHDAMNAAVDGLGNLFVAWEQVESVNPETLVATVSVSVQRWTATSGWSAPVRLPGTPGIGGEVLRFVTSQNGGARLFFLRQVSHAGVEPASLGAHVALFEEPNRWSMERRLDLHLSTEGSVDDVVATRSSSGGAIANFVWRSSAQAFTQIESSLRTSELWTRPTLVTPASTSEYRVSPSLASNDSEAVTTWVRVHDLKYEVWLSRFSPVGGWGAPLLISNATTLIASTPQVVMGPGSTFTVVWAQGSGAGGPVPVFSHFDGMTQRQPTVLSSLPVGGQTGPDLHSNNPAVASDGKGEILVAWCTTNNSVAWQRIRNGVRTGEVRQSALPRQCFRAPEVSMDERGNALILVTEWRGAANEEMTIHLRAISDSPETQTTETWILNTKPVTGPFRIVTLPGGRTAAIWVEGDSPYRLVTSTFE